MFLPMHRKVSRRGMGTAKEEIKIDFLYRLNVYIESLLGSVGKSLVLKTSAVCLQRCLPIQPG